MKQMEPDSQARVSSALCCFGCHALLVPHALYVDCMEMWHLGLIHLSDRAHRVRITGPSTSLAPVRMGRKRRLTGSSSAPAAKVSKPKGPPPKVDLGKLPDGVPEEVPIFCNGRTALLLIRQQKVFLDGELMPPSRFEQVCGKGDAKKWKATLFHFNTIKEQPTVCMQVCNGALPTGLGSPTCMTIYF